MSDIIRESKIARRRCRRLFLDSGAHSLYSLHVMNVNHKFGYDWYESKEFYAYCDQYAAFVKKYAKGVDYYANVDVIFNPELTWKAQKYLEDKHGLNPVPVVHHGTALSWLDRYLRAGYKFVGIGGLGQEATADDYRKWADGVFSRLCSGADRLPCVRTHGFAMTSFSLMRRHPWWSVDSASWAKNAGFGNIFVPHKRNGRFTFDVEPYTIGFSTSSDTKAKKNQHYLTLSKGARAVVEEWLEFNGVQLGIMYDGQPDDPKEQGVLNHYGTRATCNLRYFQMLCESIPPYPRPFLIKPRRGLLG